MFLVIFYVLNALAADVAPSTEIWTGLKMGLQKNGTAGDCLKTYPVTVAAYEAFQGSLGSPSLSPKLHSFQLFFEDFSKLVTICKVESLFTNIFGIYQWPVLQPILYTLAGNLTYFLLLLNYFQLAVTNGFYYDIGFYLGKIIQLVFSYSI